MRRRERWPLVFTATGVVLLAPLRPLRHSHDRLQAWLLTMTRLDSPVALALGRPLVPAPT